MKKLVALLLVSALALSLCSCGKSKAVTNVEDLISAIGEVSLDSGEAIASAQEAFDALSPDEKSDVENYYILVDSQTAFQQMEADRVREEQEIAKLKCGRDAYDNTKAAWKIANQFGDDLYSIWHGSVWKKQEMVDKGINFFIDETTLTEEEVIEGLASRCYVNMKYAETGIIWNDLPEETQQEYRDFAVEQIEKNSRAGYYMGMDDALLSIVNAYMLSGKVYAAQESIEAAKVAIKELSELDANYEHSTTLKEFYSTASALLDFCVSPSGSFDQYKILLNDYRREAKDCMNDLSFIFE